MFRGLSRIGRKFDTKALEVGGVGPETFSSVQVIVVSMVVVTTRRA